MKVIVCSVKQVGFEFLTAVSMKMAVIWVVAPPIALMMEAASTSETLVNFYQTTRCYNPEDSHLQCKTRLRQSEIFMYLAV
jgi:hypothetical protein